MAAFTKGPWSINVARLNYTSERPEIIGAGEVVAAAYATGTDKDRAEAIDNARLIAAAPDLYGALKFIMAFYEPGYPHLDTEAWKVAERRARAALASVQEAA